MTRLVIVTGTSRGVGEKIAFDLLEKGYKVVGISRSTNSESLRAVENFHEISFDLGETSKIADLANRILREHGTPYGIINNAALGLDGLLATQNNLEIEKVLSVNLLSPILLTKYLSRQMLDLRRGRIVFISSVAASTGYKGLSVYSASKAGLLGFTRVLSRELGGRKITVNCIQPGFLRTEMSQNITREALEKIEKRSALGNLIEARDVSEMVLFLLSKKGQNISGQSLTIDAGSTA